MTKYELLNILYAERNRVEKNFTRPGWSLWAIGAAIVSMGWLAWSYAEQCHSWRYAIMTFYMLFIVGNMTEMLLSPFSSFPQIPIWVNGYSKKIIKYILEILAYIGLSVFQLLYIPHDFCLFLYWYTLGFNIGCLASLFIIVISGKGNVVYQKEAEHTWLLFLFFLPSLVFVVCYMLELQHDSIAIRMGTIGYAIFLLLSLIPVGQKKIFLQIDRLITRVLYEAKSDVNEKVVLQELELYTIGLRYGKYLSRKNIIDIVAHTRELFECSNNLLSSIRIKDKDQVRALIQDGQAKYDELNALMSANVQDIRSVYHEDNVDLSLTPILSACRVGQKEMEFWSRLVTIVEDNDASQQLHLIRTAYEETIGLPEIQALIDDESRWDVYFGVGEL